MMLVVRWLTAFSFEARFVILTSQKHTHARHALAVTKLCMAAAVDAIRNRFSMEFCSRIQNYQGMVLLWHAHISVSSKASGNCAQFGENGFDMRMLCLLVLVVASIIT